MFEKIQEIFSNIWVKLLAIIPTAFFILENREKVMIFALLVMITIDCIFGMAVAKYITHNFNFSLMGKKFSKKFLLYFFTLLASFIISCSYDFLEWWFYVIGSILTLSEFGSLMNKAKMLGLPVDVEIISALNYKIECYIRGACGLPPKNIKE